ncbi:polysaccharide deacetylase family protein [Defluviitalea saccharophila]|uniref:Polysaccharide deacetylase family protein n=1 Tax=Defluviitalea saccharophila TaxID=879970 RepID=A0ABZ2Y2A2_9FIRM
MIYIYIEDNNFKKQIQYVFSLFFFVLGQNVSYIECLTSYIQGEKDILIAYIDSKDAKKITDKFKNIIIIKASKKLFGEYYLQAESIPSFVNRFILEIPIKCTTDIISIFSDGQRLFIKKDNMHIHTNIDFISDAFFMLSRYEEVVLSHMIHNERYKRFSAKHSLAYKHNFLGRPIVNEYIELLWSWIEDFNLGYKRKKWWGNKDFVVCLSHDVDYILKHNILNKRQVKETLSNILTLKKLDKGLDDLGKMIKNINMYKKDPYWTFEYLMKIEKKYGFSSSFYFMVSGNSEYDNNYLLKDYRVKSLINKMIELDFEVGYHGSYNTFNNKQLMKQEKRVLDSVVYDHKYGCRQHYLRFKVPDTWRYQSYNKFIYDTSMGYPDCEGFRCGTCFPFKPYDLIHNKVINMWEIPLIVMDMTLCSNKYKRLKANEAYDRCVEMIEIIDNYQGVFTILWHNSFFGEANNEWKKVYERVLKYLSAKQCEAMSGKQIINIIEGYKNK